MSASGSPDGKSKKGGNSNTKKSSNNSSFSASPDGKKETSSSPKKDSTATPSKKTPSKPSSSSATTAPSPAAPAAKQLSAEGLRNNEIVVPSPLYALYWLDEKTIIVGGGGGEAKFGMPNIFVMLRLQAPSSSSGLFWKQVASLQLGEEIVWCSSEPRLTRTGEDTQATETTDPCLTYHISYSSKGKCQTLVCKCHSLDDKRCEIKLLASCPVVAKDDDEDKKPIAVAGTTLFVAQDDNTVAVVEADSCKKSGTIDKFEGTSLWAGRIRTMLAKEVGESGDKFCLITGSEDKRVLILQIEKSDGKKEDKSGAAGSWTVKSCSIMNEKSMNLNFTLMPSSYKSMHWDNKSSSKSSGFIVNAYDTDGGDSHLIQFGDVIENSSSLKVKAPVHISVVKKDCVTDICQNDKSKRGTVIVGTADGQLMELGRSASGVIQGTPPMRLQSQLHFISVTQVARNNAGVLASTDIGQRVNLTQTLPGGGKGPGAIVGLPPTFKVNKFWRFFIVFLFFITVITAYVLLLL